MKTKIKIILLIFLTISTISCVRDVKSLKDKAAGIFVDLDTIKFQPSVEDLFKQIEIIPLETTSESIIEYSGSLKYQAYNEKFYVLSPKQNKLIVFDSKGNFIKSINKTGNGPGEYRMIYDFEISRFDGRLNLMTPYGKVLIYDSDGEKFIESFSLPDSIRAVHHFKILNKDTYVFNSDSENIDLFFYSKSKNEVVSSLSTLPNFLMSTPFNFGPSPFSYYNDSLRYHMGYDGSLYNIDFNDFSLNKRYFLDFGKHNFILSDLPLNRSALFYWEYSKSIANKIATGFVGFFETDNYLITRFRYKNEFYALFYNKIDDKLQITFKTKEGVELMFSFMENDIIYGVIPAEFAHLFVNDKVVSVENFEKLQKLTSDSNLLMIKYVLK